MPDERSKTTRKAKPRRQELNAEIVKIAGVLIVVLNTDGNVALINRKGCETLGYEEEELLGKNWFANCVPPQISDDVEREFRRLISSNLQNLEYYENTVITKQGEERLIAWHNALLKDETGNITDTLSSGEDITLRKKAEDALARSESKYRELVEGVNSVLLRWSSDGIITFINEYGQSFFGYSSDELIGKNVSILVPEKDSTGVDLTQLARDITEDPKRYTGNVNENIRRDGSRVWMSWTNKPVFDENGVVREILAIGNDITELKNARDALAESETRLKEAQRIASLGYWDWDVATGKTRWSDEVYRIFGSNPGASGGTYASWLASVHPDDRGAVEKAVNLALADPGKKFELEYRILRPDGSKRVILGRGEVMFDRDGTPVRMVGTVLDITERKEMEERHLHLASFPRLNPNPVIEISSTGSTRYRNPATQRELEGLGFDVNDCSPFLPADFPDISRILSQGKEGSFYREITIKDRVFAETIQLIPRFDSMRIYAHDITSRTLTEEALREAYDELEVRVQERTIELKEAYESLKREITERQKVEERLRQSQKMEAIGTLAGGIAHDFNNILAAIMGFTEMAIEDVADRPPVENNLKNVLKSTVRARDLVRQILAFSRKTSYERTTVSLSPLVKETVLLLRASIPAGIEIRLNISATSDTVLASPTEVQQILMNLATNAALAMKEKGGILEISLTEIDFLPALPLFETGTIPGEYIQLMVRDTGIGMSPDVMKRAFEPFFTTRTPGEGTGMGLAVVYGIVTDLKGTITMESEPGTGSIFRVFLPKLKTDVPEERMPVDQIPLGSESILFVDDENMLAEWAKAALERLGYRATVQTDPVRALKIFLSDPSGFDLVITDQSMPSMSGIQLAGELLAIRPDIPIIICTGHGTTVSPETAKKTGVEQILMKPVVRQELAEAVRKSLDKSRKG